MACRSHYNLCHSHSKHKPKTLHGILVKNTSSLQEHVEQILSEISCSGQLQEKKDSRSSQKEFLGRI